MQKVGVYRVHSVGVLRKFFLALLNSRLGFTTFLPDDQQELHVVHVVAVK